MALGVALKKLCMACPAAANDGDKPGFVTRREDFCHPCHSSLPSHLPGGTVCAHKQSQAVKGTVRGIVFPVIP